MLETIKFELSSRMAIIKKPDSNETYFKYTFTHKIMIYGILGAIIGLNGYNYYSLKKCLKEDVEELPEFYSKLCNLNDCGVIILPSLICCCITFEKSLFIKPPDLIASCFWVKIYL